MVYNIAKKGRIIMLEQKILEFVTKYGLIEEGDKIVLGVSGGPDSICMLDIVDKISQEKLIDFEIVVAHINHGLRENAILDEKFVEEFCKEKEIPFFVKHSNIQEIAKEEKKGLEETGREVRYKFFDEIMKKTVSNKIAIAHNLNDKIETIMMNLLRGSGLKGLIGIEEKNGKYIRPLIETAREDIEKYLKENKIEARHDESNDENIYTRNKIRNIVIPYIQKEFNPNIIETINRLSDIVKEEEQYLQNETEKVYRQICIQESNLTNDYSYNKLNNAEIIDGLIEFDIDKF